ncbi:MAG: protein translocase subunit SecF [Pseudomonadota bacterium]
MKTKIIIPFIKYRFILIGISAIFFAGSIVAIATKGLNYGIDFKGGAKLEYKFNNQVSEGDIRQALEGAVEGSASVVRFGAAKENRMSIKVELPEEHAKIGETVTAALEKAFGPGSMVLEKEETVGPRVGAELRKKALLATIFSWLLMMVYIAYRFEFVYAPGALLSLVHDTVITVGIFALLQKEIDLTILAALLTLIGYSINDTIVVFDRIRENKHRIAPATIWEVVNDSINSTFSRTIITSLTVFFIVVVLFLKGGGTLHDFAFCMIIGVIIGTYSSIFIASPIYIGTYHYWPMVQKFINKKR